MAKFITKSDKRQSVRVPGMCKRRTRKKLKCQFTSPCRVISITTILPWENRNAILLDVQYKRLTQAEADALPAGSRVYVQWPNNVGPFEHLINPEKSKTGYSSVNNAFNDYLMHVGLSNSHTIVWLKERA